MPSPVCCWRRPLSGQRVSKLQNRLSPREIGGSHSHPPTIRYSQKLRYTTGVTQKHTIRNTQSQSHTKRQTHTDSESLTRDLIFLLTEFISNSNILLLQSLDWSAEAMVKNGGAWSAGVVWSAERSYENGLERGAPTYVGARNAEKKRLGARSASPKIGRSAERWKPPDGPLDTCMVWLHHWSLCL